MTTPDLSGIEQLPQPDPRGRLALRNLPDDLQRAEDSTQHSDFVNWAYVDWRSEPDPATGVWIEFFERPATDTERTLLTALGYDLPDDLTTRVSFPSPLTRRRRWPQLETTTEGSTTP